jgi:hypothetical protein
MRSHELERHRQAVELFTSHLASLLETMTPMEGRFLRSARTWVPKPECEQQAAELRMKLNQLTGPAAEALEVAHVRVDYKPRGTMQRFPMNPVTAWTTILTDDPMLDVSILFDCCHQAVGRLQEDVRQARAREESLAGLIGRFVSFPRRVREAAGLPPGGFAGRVAEGAGVLAQVFVTVLAGLLLAFLVKLLNLGG